MAEEEPGAAASIEFPAGFAVAGGAVEAVLRPGSYVWNDTGRLLRVPDSGPMDGNTAVIEFMAPRGPSRVTRLSHNPRLPIPELRILSAAASIPPRF